MVGDVTRSSTENSLEVWPLKIKVSMKKINSQTAIIILCKIHKEICNMFVLPHCEEGHSSASLEFIPSVYKGKALPASQADTHTHTQMSSSIILGQWIFCQRDVHMHVYLSFPVGCNKLRLLDTGQLCYL